MEMAEIQRALDDVFDHAVLYHGFTDYMRDYEVIIYASADPSTGIPPDHLRYLFRHCVEARVATTLTPAIWNKSLDERLIDYETGVDLDGYVWGVKWHGLYPGGRLIPGSDKAATWAAALQRPFHEVEIETNAHLINLVFSDLVVNELADGWSPFVLHHPPPKGQ